MVKNNVLSMETWEDYETFGTLTFQVSQKIFFHVLRKPEKTIFTLREHKEFPANRAQYDDFFTSGKKVENVKRWVTLANLTVAVTKKGRISSYLSRILSSSFYDVVSLNISDKKFVSLCSYLAKTRTFRKTGMVNTTASTVEALEAFSYFITNHVSGCNPSVFIEKEVKALALRNNIRTEKSLSFDKFVTYSSFPLEEQFEGLSKQLQNVSYDAAEALSCENFDDALLRATYKREKVVKRLMSERFLSSDNGDGSQTELFATAVNFLTLTKSYATDEERVEGIKQIFSQATPLLGKREIVKKSTWDVLRKIFKATKTNTALRGEALNIALSTGTNKQLEVQVLFEKIDNIRREANSGSENEPAKNKPQSFILTQKTNHYSSLTTIEMELKLNFDFVPQVWKKYNYVTTLSSLFIEIDTALLSGKTLTIPERVLKSYRKNFSAKETVGYPKGKVADFLEDERMFIRRKLSRFDKKLCSSENVEKLLTLTLMTILVKLRSNSKQRKVSNIPNKVYQALKDGVSDELMREIVLTEETDYEIISSTFDLPAIYRHAILEIEAEDNSAPLF